MVRTKTKSDFYVFIRSYQILSAAKKQVLKPYDQHALIIAPGMSGLLANCSYDF
jgi:hypothetical protein